MKKDLIKKFEEALRKGENPGVEEYQKKFGPLDEDTLKALWFLWSMMSYKDEMTPSGESEEKMDKFVMDLINKKAKKSGLKSWGERSSRKLEPLAVPPPLTWEYGPVPVVSFAAAGPAIESPPDALKNEEGFPTVRRPFDMPYKDAFAIEIKGDSLEPIIPAGSYVLIDPRKEVYSGCLSLILTRNYEATVKRIKLEGDKVILISCNPAYPPKELKKSEILKMYLVRWIKIKE